MPPLRIVFVLALSVTITACMSSPPNAFKSDCGYLELRGEKPLTFTIESPTAVALDGVICSGSLHAFEHLLTEFPNVHTLNIDIIEGSVDDETNLQLSRKIHDQGLSTHLNQGGLIASGGVDLFLSGKKRTAGDIEPKIGVHSWGSSDGEEGSLLPKSHPLHDEYLSYYRYININTEFYWFTLEAASAKNIHWMSVTEMATYNVLNE